MCLALSNGLSECKLAALGLEYIHMPYLQFNEEVLGFSLKNLE